MSDARSTKGERTRRALLAAAIERFGHAGYRATSVADITRDIRPPQVSFGAKGPHHCLGAPLARMEIRVLLEEMIAQRLRFEQTGPVVRTRSSFVNGIAAFPARVTAG